jgi:alpha-L-fucosidase
MQFRAVVLRLFLLLVFLLPALGAVAQYAPMVADAQAQQRIDWWRQARFGMFLHWGVYSIPGRGEWVQWKEQIPVDDYARLADQFHPDHFDADAWAQLAKAGGMKYMVLTARHHDGFALFDDPESSFTAVKSVAHRDLVADYVQAVRKAGLGVGLYYSPIDWRFPGFFFPGIYRESAEQLRAQYHRQIGQLAAHYGKLDILWFDGGGNEWLGFGGIENAAGGWQRRPKDKPYTGAFDWQDEKAVSQLRQLQPRIVLNDRTNAAADFRSREGDAAMGGFENQQPWELCTTITEGAWGYQPGAKVKPLAQLIQLLAGVAGRDGNLLLNVGPQPDGQIAPEQAARVRQIGQWLAQFGESIYATRGGPWLPGNYGVSTHNGKAVYLHILHPPASGKLTLPALPVRIVKAQVLHGADIAVEQTAQVNIFTLPAVSADSFDLVLKLELAEPWVTSAVLPSGDQAKGN